jgi:hypothetical protein
MKDITEFEKRVITFLRKNDGDLLASELAVTLRLAKDFAYKPEPYEKRAFKAQSKIIKLLASFW